MTFASAADGAATDDPAVHNYRWMRVDPDAAAILQDMPWIRSMSPAGAGGLTLFAWTDCVALATEAWRLVTSAEPMSIVRRPPGALATAAVINITIKSNDQAITRHRALAAAHLRAVAAEIREAAAQDGATAADKDKASALDLKASDLLTRLPLSTPGWMTGITYGAAHSQCRFGLLRMLYFYNGEALRARPGSQVITVLQMLRDACTMGGLLVANTAGPAAAPIEADFAAETDAAVRAQLLAVALAAHADAPPPDNQDAEITAHVVISQAARNHYETKHSLRSDAKAGAERHIHQLHELQGCATTPDGDSQGMQMRLKGMVAAEAQSFERFVGLDTIKDMTNGELAQLMAEVAASLKLDTATLPMTTLGTVRGLAALERAMARVSTWMRHTLYNHDSTELDTEGKLEALREHLDELEANGPSVGAGAVRAATEDATRVGPMGKGASQGAIAAYQKEYAQGASSELAHELAEYTADPQHSAAGALERGFRGCSEEHPNRRSTAFIHAILLNNISPCQVSHHLWRFAEYSSDLHRGEYYAKMIMAAMVRAKHLSTEREKKLYGFSMVKLSQGLRGDWSKIDLYHVVFHAIEEELARRNNAVPPDYTTPERLVYTDMQKNAKLPTVLRGLMEALSQQTKGECSLYEAMLEHNSQMAGLTGFGAKAVAQLLLATAEMYRGMLGEAGRAYHAATNGQNVIACFPPTNLRPEALDRLNEVFNLKKDGLDEAQRQIDMAHHLDVVGSSSKQARGENSMAEAMALLRGDQTTAPNGGGGGKEGEKRQSKAEKRKAAREAEEQADAAAKKAKADKQKTSEENLAKRHALFKAAGQGVLSGPADNQIWTFGPVKFNLTKARAAYPGKCVLAICAGACGGTREQKLELQRQVCRSGAEAHPDGCAEHTFANTDPLPFTMRANDDGTPYTKPERPNRGGGRGDGGGRGGKGARGGRGGRGGKGGKGGGRGGRRQ